MKYKYVMWSFLVLFPAALAIRTYQLFALTDPVTAFFYTGVEKLGTACSLLIAAAIFGFVAISSLVKRKPRRTPRVNLGLGASSAFAAIFILMDTMDVINEGKLGAWQWNLLCIFGGATGVFLLFYAAKGFYNYKINRLFYVLPAIYYAQKIVCQFMIVARFSAISETIYIDLSLVLVALFFLEWSKMANDIVPENSYKNILALGGSAVILCGVTCLPEFALLIIKKDIPLHYSPLSLISLAFTGLFIAVFVYRCFTASLTPRSVRKRQKIKTLK